jgi:hypothetical protein
MVSLAPRRYAASVHGAAGGLRAVPHLTRSMACCLYALVVRPACRRKTTLCASLFARRPLFALCRSWLRYCHRPVAVRAVGTTAYTHDATRHAGTTRYVVPTRRRQARTGRVLARRSALSTRDGASTAPTRTDVLGGHLSFVRCQ